MGPTVALQLIAAGESLATVAPGADEGPLPRVPAQVGTQVRCLPINLSTTWDVANMLLFLAHTRAPEHMHTRNQPPHSAVSPHFIFKSRAITPMQVRAFYLPPASLQLGQVQATLRNLFPS